VDAEDKVIKMKKLSCPLCHMEVYSDVGKGCKLCGMVLEDKSKEFCCRTCRTKYNIEIMHNAIKVA
jgi:hypothetical protein